MTRVAVARERAPGERRVAIVPAAVPRLQALGLDVVVEPGAGAAAWFPDEAYTKAGAQVGTTAGAGILLGVGPPPVAPGQAAIGLLDPLRHRAAVRQWLAGGVTAVSLDLLPRTLSRAQSMDALSSQAAVAGYRAVLVAAEAFGQFFPMLTTAAGTFPPARVLVLGAGVAGLSAIATARRLGAAVTAYDVRPAARGEVESLGARFLPLAAVTAGAGQGGYARQLSSEEQHDLAGELAGQVARFDVVITTAQLPAGPPPLLVTAAALAEMEPGSVVLDLAAGKHGGNVAGSRPDRPVVTAGGVTVIGCRNLPASMPTAASAAYARNLTALLAHLVRDGQLHIDPIDEIQAAVVVTHQGQVVNPAVARLLDPALAGGGR